MNLVPEAELTELRRRINATRWPERETVTDATQGVQLATMEKLARYWRTEYNHAYPVAGQQGFFLCIAFRMKTISLRADGEAIDRAMAELRGEFQLKYFKPAHDILMKQEGFPELIGSHE